MPYINDAIKKHGRLLMHAVIVGIMMWPATGMAAQSVKGGAKIRRITPMTEIGSHQSNLNANDYFDVVGLLNKIDGNQVTIGDRELTLAPGVRTPRVKQYTVVGAKLNQAGEIVVIELVSDDPN